MITLDHIISIHDLTRDQIEHILQKTRSLKQQPRPALLKGRILATCFFEPSTRTRLSFEVAMLKLGGSVTSLTDLFSSKTKGESLSDTIKVVSRYADVIVLRHPKEGSSRLASKVSSVPVINGGDGANQHPTQTLLDLYTIQECQGSLEGLHVALYGDLKWGRTVHSLAEAACHFNMRLYFINPPGLEMPAHILTTLKNHHIKFSLHKDLSEILPKLDILYVTRLQKERFLDTLEFHDAIESYHLEPSHLKGAKSTLRILHPLPRNDELSPLVDTTSYAYYFEQAENGLYVRQTLLGLLLGAL